MSFLTEPAGSIEPSGASETQIQRAQRFAAQARANASRDAGGYAMRIDHDPLGPAEGSLESACNRLEVLCNQVDALHDRVARQADRLVGVLPASDNRKAATSPSPNGMISTVHLLIDALQRTLSATEDDLARIERA